MRFSGALGVLLMAAVLQRIFVIYSVVLAPFNETITAESCILLNGDTMFSSEDVTLWKEGKAFVSAGDLGPLVGWGHFPNGTVEGIAHPGEIYLVDVTSTPKATPLEIRGFPSWRSFQPHGIFFSNKTQRLYAVSHGTWDDGVSTSDIDCARFARGGSRVEVFKVVPPANALVLPSLAYERTIAPEDPRMFFNLGLNDVVEGGGNDIYVTNWLERPIPAHGKHYPATVNEYVDVAVQETTMLNIPFLHKSCVVYHCVWDDTSAPEAPATCHVVLDGYWSANGITISDDRSTLIVNEMYAKMLHVYDIQGNGALIERDTILLDQICDNLEYDQATGDITMGCIPDVVAALQGLASTSHDTLPPSKGSLVVLVKTTGADGRQRWKEDTTRAMLHSGTIQSGTSVAVPTLGRVIFGSPFAKGVLVCDER